MSDICNQEHFMLYIVIVCSLFSRLKKISKKYIRASLFRKWTDTFLAIIQSEDESYHLSCWRPSFNARERQTVVSPSQEFVPAR